MYVCMCLVICTLRYENIVYTNKDSHIYAQINFYICTYVNVYTYIQTQKLKKEEPITIPMARAKHKFFGCYL